VPVNVTPGARAAGSTGASPDSGSSGGAGGVGDSARGGSARRASRVERQLVACGRTLQRRDPRLLHDVVGARGVAQQAAREIAQEGRVLEEGLGVHRREDATARGRIVPGFFARADAPNPQHGARPIH